MAQHVRGLLALLAAVPLAAVAGPAAGQHIATDATLGRAPATLAGPSYNITADLGKPVGGNLFHSFAKFGLSQGESANFSGPKTVANIIARVTGGQASTIDGAINSSIPNANLYLINPSGIVFEQHATVNVSGSFHASTADYLRLSDGGKFRAATPGGSTLTAASPAAFGFLNAAPPAITIDGSQLAVRQGKTLGVVGGPVTIENELNHGLSAPSGTIDVAAVAGVGEVPVDPRHGTVATVSRYAPVSIGGASLDVADATDKSSGGSIFIRGGTLAMADGGKLEASNYGDGPGGVISVRADSNIAMSNGASLNARSFAAGRGADINMQTGPGGSIFASNAKVISGSASITGLFKGHFVKSIPTGGTGQIALTTGTLTLVNGAIIGSQVQGTGSSGPISVTANSLVLDGREIALPLPVTGIRSQTFGGADAADITVTTGTLAILGNGEIVTNTGAAGDAGRVSVTATGNLTIDATGAQLSTGIESVVSRGATGNAGTVTINAGSLSLTGSADPLLPSPFIPESMPFDGLSAQTLGAGTGGALSLDLNGGPLFMEHGAAISSSASGSGEAGRIALSAGRLDMRDGAAISTEAARTNGGNIVLHVGKFIELVDSRITTSVNGAFGNGGNILIDPQFLILLRSDIIAQAVEGHGGDITIVADNYFPSGDSIVSASSQLGISGTVDVIGPRVDFNGALVVLASDLRNTAEILRDTCAAKSALPRSRLIDAGRGGLPQDVEATIPAFYLAGRAAGPGGSAVHRADLPMVGRPPLGLPDDSLQLRMHCGG